MAEAQGRQTVSDQLRTYPRSYYELEGMELPEIQYWLAWYLGHPKETIFEKLLKVSIHDPKKRLLSAYEKKTLHECFTPEDEDSVERALKQLSAFDKNDKVTWRVLPRNTKEFAGEYKWRFELIESKIGRHLYSALKLFTEHFGDLQFHDPLPELTQYRDPNTILNPLPSTHNGTFDLKLLSGDLGKAAEPTPIVSKITSLLGDTLQSQVHLMVGVSGVGKTKALYDLARTYFAIYFDFSSHGDAQDFLNKVKQLLENHSTSTYESSFLPQFKRLVYQLIGARLVALLALKWQHNNLTALHWLLVQVKGHTVSDSLRPITAMLQFYSDSDLITLGELWCEINDNRKILILCDESQLLTPLGKNMFRSFVSSSEAKFNKSAFSWFVYSALTFGQICVAGTSLSLKAIDTFNTAIIKPKEDLPVLVEKSFNFPYISSTEDVKAIVERLFEVILSDEQVDYIRQRLKGRAQFFTSLANIAKMEYFQKKNQQTKTNVEILMEIVEVAFNATALNHVPKHLAPQSSNLTRHSIFTVVASKLKNNAGAARGYADLVGAYYLGKIIGYNPKYNFLEDGVAGIDTQKDTSVHYQIAEPTVVAAIMEVFLSEEINFPATYLASSSERIEGAVMLDLLLSKKEYQSVNIPNLNNKVGGFKAEKIERNVSAITYLQQPDPSKTIIHPPDYECPDIFYFSQPLLWVIASKTKVKGSLDGRAVKSNYETTDLTKFSKAKIKHHPDISIINPNNINVNNNETEDQVVKVELLNMYSVATLSKVFGKTKPTKKDLVQEIARKKMTELQTLLQNQKSITQTRATSKTEQVAPAQEQIAVEVVKLFKANKLQQIVRLHLVLPQAPKTSTKPKVAVTTFTVKNETVEFPTILYDIDLESVKECSLFSDELTEAIHTAFAAEVKKKRQREHPDKDKGPKNKRAKLEIHASAEEEDQIEEDQIAEDQMED